MSKQPNQAVPYFVLVASLLLWAGTPVVGKGAMSQLPVFMVLFWRSCVAGLGILPFFIFDHNRVAVSKKGLATLLGVGALGMPINIGLFFVGLQTASVLDMSVITALTPLLISLAGWYFLKEHVSRTQAIGFALATFGVIFALTHDGGSSRQFFGDACIAASAGAMVAYTILTKELSRIYPPAVLVASACISAIIGFAPLAAWEYWRAPQLLTALAPSLWWQIGYLGLGASVLAYVGYEWALERLTASAVAAMSYLQPLASALLGVVFLSEAVLPGYVLGGLFTLLGVFLALRQPHLRRTPAKHHLPVRASQRA